jgi:hypothetical protein
MVVIITQESRHHSHHRQGSTLGTFSTPPPYYPPAPHHVLGQASGQYKYRLLIIEVQLCVWTRIQALGLHRSADFWFRLRSPVVAFLAFAFALTMRIDLLLVSTR